MDVRTGLWRKLSAKELILLNCGVGEDSRESLGLIQPVNPKGNQSWIFIGKTGTEAETPVLWPPDAKNWLTGKDPDGGKDWRLEEKGMTEDEVVGWHHRLNGHEFEQAPWVGKGQGSLACCDSWGCKESDMTERLKWTELNWIRSTSNFTLIHLFIKMATRKLKCEYYPYLKTEKKSNACNASRKY